MSYTLTDGEARAAEHPETFDVPPAEERASLRPGDFAKVGAEFDPHETTANLDSLVRPAFERKFGQAWGERFWVQVTRICNGAYNGEVDNELAYTRHHGLHLGASIRFEPRHVLAILWADEKATDAS